MKLTLLLAVVATMLLTGCQGFLGLDYQNKKYMVGSNHSVKGYYLAGQAQNDGDYSIVVGKKGETYQAWLERDGEYVHTESEVWRLFVNPWWPFPHRTALKKGTPQELGLYDELGNEKGHNLLLSVKARHRIVSRYSACVARWGKDNVTVATNDTIFGGKRYWIEVTVDGKRYSHPTAGTYRQHYQGYNPYGEGFKEQWRGSLAEYEALVADRPHDPAQAKAAEDSMEKIPPTYWIHKNRHIWRLNGISNL